MSRELRDKDATVARNGRLRAFLLAAVIVLAVLAAIRLILAGYTYEWTGFGEFSKPKPQDVEFARGKTLWDWLELLIVPATLAVGGYLFNTTQRDRDEKIADRRTQEEREIAEERTQETALQTYLDQMSKLLIDNALSSEMKPEAKDAWENVARVWTLTVVRRVNGERKGIVLRFLYESNLIQVSNPIVSLKSADLSRVNLEGANLSEANLMDANLSGTNLSRAFLSGADLSGANLEGANLSEANLMDANLSGANLSRAFLSGAEHTRATVWPDGFDPGHAGSRLFR